MNRENTHKFIEYLATFLTLIGFYMISEGQIDGFTVSLIANILWVYWGNVKNAFALMALNVTLLFINLNGLGLI